MPISTFLGLGTALSGLEANQEAIQTTSNNIANAATPGYSEETAIMTDRSSVGLYGLSGSAGQLGAGVDVSSIRRSGDQYLTAQFRAQNAVASYDSTQSDALDQAQGAVNEPSSDGIESQLSKFWSDWNSLANNPANPATRQAIIDDGNAVTQSFNALDQQLSGIQANASTEFTSLTAPGGQLSSDAQQIASLNQEIVQAQQAGTNVNALLDQRDQLVDDLSTLGNVTVTTQANGQVQIGFGDAASPLVAGTTVNWPQTITSATGGKLGALLDISSATGSIGTQRTVLDGVANQLITSVNTLSPATPFFSGTTAATIAVSATPATVQTSVTPNPGANDVAIAIAGLSGGAPDQAYAAFVTGIGGAASAAQGSSQTSQALLTSLSSRRESIRGVSLDEEMTNLMMYQRGYQASARMMTTVDGMLDTLINHTGQVGL